MRTTFGQKKASVTRPRDVHIVDAVKGPLVGAGRERRVMPFAVTAAIVLAVAAPTTSWTRPGPVVAGSMLVVVAAVGALVLRWDRFVRAAQLVPPFAFLVGTSSLAVSSGDGLGSPFVTLAVLPLMWLAIYENQVAVVAAAGLVGTAVWLEAGGENLQSAPHPGPAIVAFVVCGGGMGLTLHGLVADARSLARDLREHDVALERAATMLDALPELVVRFQIPDFSISYCNAAWAGQYGLAPAQVVDRSLKEFLLEDGLKGVEAQLAGLGPEHPVLVDPVARVAPNAPGRWLEWVDQYLPTAEGAEILAVGRDVTDRRQVERSLAESEARFRELADRSADVVWRFVLEPEPHLDYLSPSVEKILGYPPSYLLEDFGRLLAILDDASTAAIGHALHDKRVLERFDFHFRHADGSILIGETRTAVVAGGLQGVSRDVTELRRLQASLAELALRDPLTGLANRRLFNELLDVDLGRAQRDGRHVAVAFLDLDDFKNVNDTYGHDAGDIVLRETARRLTTILRGVDSVARIGGDEFVIAFPTGDAISLDLIERIDEALAVPISISPTQSVTCSASIGVADTLTAGHDSAALIAAADRAMYQTKRARQAAQMVTACDIA